LRKVAKEKILAKTGRLTIAANRDKRKKSGKL